MQCHR